MIIFKLIMFGLIVLCFIISLLIGYFIPEAKYKKNPIERIKIITRVRLGCFLTIMIISLICLIF